MLKQGNYQTAMNGKAAKAVVNNDGTFHITGIHNDGKEYCWVFSSDLLPSALHLPSGSMTYKGHEYTIDKGQIDYRFEGDQVSRRFFQGGGNMLLPYERVDIKDLQDKGFGSALQAVEAAISPFPGDMKEPLEAAFAKLGGRTQHRG